MKYLLAVLLLVPNLCLADPVAKELQDNTVILQIGSGHGSGVLFSRDGHTFIWTAAHVANKAMRSDGTFGEIAVIQGDKRGKARVLRSGDWQVSTDCALLEVTEGGFRGNARFYPAFKHIRVGQEVLLCGTPFAFINSRLVFYGRVSYVGRIFNARPKFVPWEVDQVNLTTYPGCSGGPVVDKATGEIVGLLVMASSPGLGIIEPTRNIYDWAKRHDCLWAFDREVPLTSVVPWRGDLYDRRIRERDTSDIDARWGDPQPTLAPSAGGDGD